MHLSMAGLRAFRRCVHKDRAANVWARAPGTPTDDPRAIPPRRPPHDRLDRALPRNDRAPPRPLPRRPGRDPPAPAAPRARARRAVRRDPPGPGRRDPAGHHALAVPQLLRVLPGERVAPRDPRRSRLLRPRRAGDAVGDEPRVHRARDARARLAGGPARPPRPVQVGRSRGGGRGHPGHGLKRLAVRAARRARARHRLPDQRDGRGPRAHRLHVHPGPLLPGKGGGDRRHRPAQPAAHRGGRRAGDAPGRAGAGDRRGSARRTHAVLRVRHRGHHGVHRHRPRARDRRGLPSLRRVAARGRRARGERRALSRAPLDPRRRGARRQLLLQPPQVDAHELRLRLLLRGGSGGADLDLQRHPRVPAEPGHRVGDRVRLPRLARAVGAPLSRPEAVVRDPAVRRRGTARPHPAARGPRPGIRRLGGRRRPLRAGGACAPEPGLLPPRRGRPGEPASARRAERLGQPLSDACPPRRPAGAPPGDRGNVHRAAARGGRLAADPGPGRRGGRMRSIIGVAGAILLATVLWDAFETIVLPRRVSGRFRLTRFFYRVTWRPWRVVAALLPRRQREEFLSFYGPLSLLLLLGLWATGVVLAFGMLQWAAGSALIMTGAAPGFWTDVYMSGTTFFTLGLGDVAPRTGLAKALTVVEAGTGFAILALVIGYLPVIYQAFSRREVTISLLDARAGSPPTAGELLWRYRWDKSGDALGELLQEWERWAADVLESHLSYPPLAYFRSQHYNQSWLGALTTILDASALVMVGLEGGCVEQARLTFAMARHAVVDLAQVFNTPPREARHQRLSDPELARLQARLAEGGMRLRDEPGENGAQR